MNSENTQTRYCSFCGAKLPGRGEKVCPSCGQPVRQSAEQEAAERELVSVTEEMIRGDFSRMDRFMELTENQVYRVVSGVTRVDDPEALIMDIYTKLLRDIRSLKDPERIRSWLKNYVRDKTVSAIKSEDPYHVGFEESSEPDDPNPDDELIDRDSMDNIPDSGRNNPEDRAADDAHLRLTVKVIGKAIDTLPETDQRIVKARYLQGKRLGEIAAQTGMTVSMVETILRRSEDKIRNIVETAEEQTGTRLH